MILLVSFFCLVSVRGTRRDAEKVCIQSIFHASNGRSDYNLIDLGFLVIFCSMVNHHHPKFSMRNIPARLSHLL